MNNILGNFDRNNIKSFWELNKEFKNITFFNNLYKEDKSRSKKNTSLTMWSIALFLEVNNNSLSKLPEEIRIKNIEDILDIKFNLLSLQPVIQAYLDVTKTSLELQLYILDKKIHERNKLLDDNEYTFENAEKLDKLILNTDKLTDQYKKLKSAVEDEQSNEQVVKGGRPESLSEKNELFN